MIQLPFLPTWIQPPGTFIIREFVSSDSIALPEVESRLLGLGYMEQDWRHAIDAVFAAEHDTESAIQEVEKLATAAANTSRLTIRIQRPSGEQVAPQIIEIEKDLVEIVEKLHKLKGVKEDVPSVDELVEPKDEREADAEADKVGSGPSGDAEIVAHVKHAIAVERGEIIEVDDSEDDDDVRETRGCMLEVWLSRQWSHHTTRISAFPWLSSEHADEEHEANDIGFPVGEKIV